MRNMVLTKKEVVYRACEIVEAGTSYPSCLAICNGINDDLYIRAQYNQFLENKDHISEWDYQDSVGLKSTRILSLLLFLECGDWVLAGDKTIDYDKDIYRIKAS